MSTRNLQGRGCAPGADIAAPPAACERCGHATPIKILFVNTASAYDSGTSSVKPMGGTQSAVAHLAVALARAGVAVIVANLRTDDVTGDGVAWVSLARIQRNFADYLHKERVTHLAVVSTAAVATLRPKVAWNGAWLLWNHHWIDQPATAPLATAAVRDQWDAIISIRSFQPAGMTRAFLIRPDRHWILRNAFSPHFADLFSGARLEPMGQAAFARVLEEHDFWGYPCTFTETSCISALEAVAAGLYPVTTALGALPETLGGVGAFVPLDGDTLAERWCAAAGDRVRIRDADRVAWLHARWTQRERVVRERSWDYRAREWIACLERIAVRAGIEGD